MDDATCKGCVHYRDESYTPTGIGVAYCDEKESKRYGLPSGSIDTVVYEDSKACRYFRSKKI